MAVTCIFSSWYGKFLPVPTPTSRSSPPGTRFHNHFRQLRKASFSGSHSWMSYQSAERSYARRVLSVSGEMLISGFVVMALKLLYTASASEAAGPFGLQLTGQPY